MMNMSCEPNVRVRIVRPFEKTRISGHQASTLNWRGAILTLRPKAAVRDVAPPVILK
jgi:hypothetical protein